jgi:imidazole glycerol-phosphate synthase subunit HisH
MHAFKRANLLKTPSVTIVDYDAGNIRSVQRACSAVGMDARVTASPEELLTADRLIFPGVGTAESAMHIIRQRGLDEALRQYFSLGKPLLGICLGLQVVMDTTEEGQETCLGIIPGGCHKFRFTEPSLKVPQIGWNQIQLKSQHPMFGNIRSGDEFYFVHSYYAQPSHADNVLAQTTYGDIVFASVIGQRNLFATQFHLEKSGRLGLALLASFAQWDGTEC